MTINGLGQFDMMSAYNRINSIPKAPVENVAKPQVQENQKADDTVKVQPEAKEEIKAEEKAAGGLKINLNLDGIRAKSNASLEDISRDFTKRDNFSIRGFDEVESPDEMAMQMEKAVSEMQKDSSLKQYQYFVGEGNVITNDEDGIVIMK